MRLLLTASLLMLGAVPLPVAARKPAPAHRLTTRQARALVRLVARHEAIDVGDSHIEMNSLDLMSPFVAGYSSYIVIREATTPGPDETLRRYAVNRQTGDVWELTLCRRYDFPQLQRMQRAFTGHGPASAAQLAAERRQLGCATAGNPAPQQF